MNFFTKVLVAVGVTAIVVPVTAAVAGPVGMKKGLKKSGLDFDQYMHLQEAVHLAAVNGDVDAQNAIRECNAAMAKIQQGVK